MEEKHSSIYDQKEGKCGRMMAMKSDPWEDLSLQIAFTQKQFQPPIFHFTYPYHPSKYSCTQRDTLAKEKKNEN